MSPWKILHERAANSTFTKATEMSRLNRTQCKVSRTLWGGYLTIVRHFYWNGKNGKMSRWVLSELSGEHQRPHRQFYKYLTREVQEARLADRNETHLAWILSWQGPPSYISFLPNVLKNRYGRVRKVLNCRRGSRVRIPSCASVLHFCFYSFFVVEINFKWLEHKTYLYRLDFEL